MRNLSENRRQHTVAAQAVSNLQRTHEDRCVLVDKRAVGPVICAEQLSFHIVESFVEVTYERRRRTRPLVVE